MVKLANVDVLCSQYILIAHFHAADDRVDRTTHYKRIPELRVVTDIGSTNGMEIVDGTKSNFSIFLFELFQQGPKAFVKTLQNSKLGDNNTVKDLILYDNQFLRLNNYPVFLASYNNRIDWRVASPFRAQTASSLPKKSKKFLANITSKLLSCPKDD